jgi:hypothetical protein
MRKSGIAYTSIIVLLFSCFGCNSINEIPGLQLKKIDYPSASTIEYVEGLLYLVGDDATTILVLDTALDVIESIPLFPYTGRRIPKDIKPDIEASASYGDHFYLFGSGSLSPYRNYGLRHNFKTSKHDSIGLEALYLKVKSSGIEQINIEGACIAQENLVMVNRGNKGYPYNQLIVINEAFLNNDSGYQITVIPFEAQEDTTLFKGISGLCYSKEGDKLILTVSTEDTRNSYEDGAIGKSYLWIINNASTKLDDTSIKPDRRLDLEYIDHRFKGQKIESATIIRETEKLIYLALVADNDDGSSTVFKLSVPKITAHSE